MAKRAKGRASPEHPPVVRVDDPRSIRALAHPARLAIIDALASGDELTATQCAELTSLSPSATAYHLTLLERYGFVEPASLRADRRERPWRMSSHPVSVDIDTWTPAGSAAAAAVVAAYMDTTRAIAGEFIASAHAEPEVWRDAELNNSDLWLTAEEFGKLAKDLERVLVPYRGRRQTDDRPAGSRRVRVMNVVVPHPLRTTKGARGKD